MCGNRPGTSDWPSSWRLNASDIMRDLIEAGVSQSEIARELGVSRQAVQKMLAC